MSSTTHTAAAKRRGRAAKPRSRSAGTPESAAAYRAALAELGLRGGSRAIHVVAGALLGIVGNTSQCYAYAQQEPSPPVKRLLAVLLAERRAAGRDGPLPALTRLAALALAEGRDPVLPGRGDAHGRTLRDALRGTHPTIDLWGNHPRPAP